LARVGALPGGAGSVPSSNWGGFSSASNSARSLADRERPRPRAAASSGAPPENSPAATELADGRTGSRTATGGALAPAAGREGEDARAAGDDGCAGAAGASPAPPWSGPRGPPRVWVKALGQRATVPSSRVLPAMPKRLAVPAWGGLPESGLAPALAPGRASQFRRPPAARRNHAPARLRRHRPRGRISVPAGQLVGWM